MATCSNRRRLSISLFLFVNSEDFCVSVCPIFPYICVSVCPIFHYICVSVCPIFPYICVSVCPIFPYIYVCLSARYSLIPVYLSARYSLISVCLCARYPPIPMYLSARIPRFPCICLPDISHFAEAHSNLTLLALLPTVGRYRLPSNFVPQNSSVYCLLSFVSRGISPINWNVQMCREIVLGLVIGGTDSIALLFSVVVLSV